MYEYRHVKLQNSPLSLVLCQIKFSKVRRMPEFIPQIQDALRKEGFPVDASYKMQHVKMEPNKAPEIIEVSQDEFRSKDNQRSIIVSEDMLVLMTTAYDDFDTFSKWLRQSLEIIDDAAQIRHGVITRIGLRYVNIIDPENGKTFRNYLKDGFHGVTKSSVFIDDNPWLQFESGGKTNEGMMIVRTIQNSQGLVFPPDILINNPMNCKIKITHSNPITLVDIDHFSEGNFDYDLNSIMKTADDLHHGINSNWFNDIVTNEALAIWEQSNV